MVKGAYYNEFDPYAAQWLRNLIAAGHIAPGDVDARSIKEVQPDDLKGYTQAHFFAGIGVWSHALRLAGWPDDLEVWTGSCPCQPFSTAGKQKGFDDARHLWPDWFRLIAERRPLVIFGEQVAHKSALPWLDAVCADLEGACYAVGANDICAAGIGAPHIRQRLYFVADRDSERLPVGSEPDGDPTQRQQQASRRDGIGGRGENGRLADGGQPGLERRTGVSERTDKLIVGQNRVASELGDAGRTRSRRHAGALPGEESSVEGSLRCQLDESEPTGTTHELGNSERSRPRISGRPATDIADESSYWSLCDWIPCRDGKFRPVEPGTFPLVNGAPARVGRLRAYGNAIVAPQAVEFIRAYRELAP